MGKRRSDLLQNAAILVLSLSAALLLAVVIPLELNGESGLARIGQFFAGEQAQGGQTSDLTHVAAPMNLVFTNSYGRRGELLTTTLSDTALQCGSLIREAAGSASAPEQVPAETLLEWLNGRGIFMDFLFPLPTQVAAGWFGAEYGGEGEVRFLLLSADSGENCALLLWDGSGEAVRCRTAVPSATLLDFLNSVDTNGARFAYEAGEAFSDLSPLTLLPADRLAARTLSAALPAEAVDPDRLLGVLGFNVHTNYRYPEADGTQVVVESPRTLRIQPDGLVVYAGDTESSGALFTIAAPAGEEPTAAGAALTALRLAEAVMPPELSGSGSFFLTGVRREGEGWRVTLGISANGMPIYFSDSTAAAEVVFTGGTVTGFTLRCRSYALTEETVTLLPLEQAAAIAAGEGEDVFLTAGYVDRGGDTAAPAWLLH